MPKLKAFRDQSYKELKWKCTVLKTLFVDPTFPVSDGIFDPDHRFDVAIEWKRPSELCEKPVFASPLKERIQRGYLGNVWFSAVCAALVNNKPLWNAVIPDSHEQEWDHYKKEKYAGIFHFRFWIFGEWVDVVIDDYLPTSNGRLLSAQSSEFNEYWVGLLEKAYAKVHGSYKHALSTNAVDALLHFTGGFPETVENATLGNSSYIFKMLTQELSNNSVICCAINPETENEIGSRVRGGLILGHMYVITGTRNTKVNGSREKVKMVRLRDPWSGLMWTGPFQDEWETWCFSMSTLRRLYTRPPSVERRRPIQFGALSLDDDKQFWIEFDNFLEIFTDILMCSLIKSCLVSNGKIWDVSQHYGKWTAGGKGFRSDRCGGCSNFESFLRNPQYAFSLQQKDTIRIMIQQRPSAPRTIVGFQILPTEVNRSYRLHQIVEPVATSEYSDIQTIFHKCTLAPGRYVIIPTTFEANVLTDYLIRIVSSNNVYFQELHEEYPLKSGTIFCKSYPICATVVTVMSASGLKEVSKPQFHCVIRCENQSAKSHVVKGSNHPEWNVQGLFYRKKANSPVIVEVYNSCLLHSSCVGKAVLRDIPIETAADPLVTDVRLITRNWFQGPEGALNECGTVKLRVQSYEDFTTV